MADSRPDLATEATPTVDHESMLLVSRPGDAGATAYCRDHLAGTAEPGRPLLVRTGRTGTAAQSDPGERAAVVVAVDGPRRSSAEPTDPPAASDGPPETVPAGPDLAAVGSAVDRYLRTWRAAGERPTVCVDALSGLLDRSSVRGSYRFLYVLRRQVGRSGGAFHAHAGAHVHEEEILRTFYPLFDRVVAFTEGSAPY